MKKNKLLYLILGFILISIPVYCAATIIKSARNDKNSNANYNTDSTELNRIVDVINIIDNRFVGKETPNKDELYKAAVTGVVNRLNDPYSEYLSQEDLKNFSEDIVVDYVGVGLSIQ